ncbi:uncharacterized protein LOC105171851 [Sesamum indicum]|uniref:Vacuolar iron transporter n=1 Tax=Sesamum indicum TaxID=4182 RepID=A0A6I9U1T9_SESIN|nr:uncharacterized protein LOC105171851 [Sesamum indicum]
MGFGDFVSTSTERDVAAKERSVTEWDVENRRRSQQEELVQRYQALGMHAADAAMVVGIFAKYPDILVDEKMVGRGIQSVDQNVALALLGLAKAKIAGQNYAVSMGITLFNGAIAGLAAYAIGWSLRNVAGLEE